MLNLTHTTRLGSLTEPCSRPERLSLIAAAVNAGITLFDTADIYAQGESERILGEALRSIDACRWFVDSPLEERVSSELVSE